MGELSEIAYIRVGEATVDEEAGNISVLWSVGSVELGGTVFEPGFQLLLGWFLVKIGWCLPRVANSTRGWMGVG